MTGERLVERRIVRHGTRDSADREDLGGGQDQIRPQDCHKFYVALESSAMRETPEGARR
jgi:hypothetical protein